MASVTWFLTDFRHWMEANDGLHEVPPNSTQTIPNELQTIGDHIKARRIALHSFQNEVATKIGVHKASLQNWERNAGTPLPRQIPAVIRFLGYVPFEHDGSASDKFRWLRICAGWTQDELALAVKCDPSTIARWESGGHSANQKLWHNAHQVLEKRLTALDILKLTAQRAQTRR